MQLYTNMPYTDAELKMVFEQDHAELLASARQNPNFTAEVEQQVFLDWLDEFNANMAADGYTVDNKQIALN